MTSPIIIPGITDNQELGDLDSNGLPNGKSLGPNSTTASKVQDSGPPDSTSSTIIRDNQKEDGVGSDASEGCSSGMYMSETDTETEVEGSVEEGENEEEDDDAEITRRNEDREAIAKNILFQGVPNSVLKRSRFSRFGHFAVEPKSSPKTKSSTPFNSYFRIKKDKRSSIPQLGAGSVSGGDGPLRTPTAADEDNGLSGDSEDEGVEHFYGTEEDLARQKNQQGQNQNRPDLKSRRSSLISLHDPIDFTGWRKEFNTAFRKMSVVSRLKSMRPRRNSTENQNNTPRKQPKKTKEEEDLRTQRLASDLLDFLIAGCPGALFASTHFLRDEHGNGRAPLLLAMLDVKVKAIDNICNTSGGNKVLNYQKLTRRNMEVGDLTLPDNSRRQSFANSSEPPGSSGIGVGSNHSADGGTNHIHQDNITTTSSRTSTSTNTNTSSSSSSSSSLSDYFNEKKGRRKKHQLFEIEFQYGIGENRYKWKIVKSYNNILEFHHSLRVQAFQQNTVKKLYIDHNRFHKFELPYFPRLKESRYADYNRNLIEPIKKRTKFNIKRMLHHRSPDTGSEILDDLVPLNSASTRSSTNFDLAKLPMKHLQDLINEPDDVSQPLEPRLEKYFRLLNLALCLRPQANKLFEFYEFSPMGNLLSYETGYQGKEGFLLIRSTAKTQGWRVSHLNPHGFKEMIERHTPKWFLVRHSYVTYVSNICSTTPLDVFLVDSQFKIKCSGSSRKSKLGRESRKGEKGKMEDDDISEFEEINDVADWDFHSSAKISPNLWITLENGERKLKILCKSEFSMNLWVASLSIMARSTIWSRKHRFNSFAPVRTNCFAKYLVDGRDYFWALSEALEMAEDVIYIHDWWLSPELYLRRPVNGNQEYRIDRLLRKKAEAGVKIYIIIYRNVGSTVGTDSLWTKHSMLNLHPNIHLIRSPNQWLQNTYFWAHHEKLAIIDNTIAFIGGIDLCFGRYDTPEHVLRDDYDDIRDQTFPGKDYSNARVCDFYELNKPFESMYDRNEVPRMPWHDIHMMTVGPAARDVARHFVQRWNYLLREKRPSRPTPLLLPPNDFTRDELENSPFFRNLKARSTCELQILRSAGYWSLGLKETENSIQMAYIKLIETSNHFIYIENQFFVTTSQWDGVLIENKIGDAIVDRIIRANSEGKDWKAIILIPLMPGFNAPIDQPEASSLRVIVQLQFQSISRGKTSIFSRLRKLNIDPVRYIQFYSLRKWSTIGPYEKLVTEQLYIHAKMMIVDDRSCIIGSANINERSQLGNRDSEVAIVIRDTDLVKTRMNGKPYYAGRFAWELRQKLMREHLGCDVDLVEFIERKFGVLERVARANFETLYTINQENTQKPNQKYLILSAMIELAYREVFDCDCSPEWKLKYGNYPELIKCHYGLRNVGSPDSDGEDLPESTNSTQKTNGDPTGDKMQKTRLSDIEPQGSKSDDVIVHSFNYRSGVENLGIRDRKPLSFDPRLVNNEEHDKEVDGKGPDGWKFVKPEFKKSVTQQLREWSLKEFSLNVDPSATTKKQKENPKQRRSILPNKRDIIAYIRSPEVPGSDKWDMLKRVCYLEYLDYKIKNREYTRPKPNQKQKQKQKQKQNQSDNVSEDADGELLSPVEFEDNTNQSFLFEDHDLDDDALDNLIGQLVPKLTAGGSSGNNSGGGYGTGKHSASNLLNLKFIDPYSFDDPLSPSFYEETWFSIALRNTLLFRVVFHCQPDNAVQSWREYKEYLRMSREFSENQDEQVEIELERNKPRASSDDNKNTTKTGDEETSSSGNGSNSISGDGGSRNGRPTRPLQSSDQDKRAKAMSLQMKLYGSVLYGFNKRIFDKYTAKRILERIQGHLVIFPTEWLAREVESRNWFYNADRLPPIDIYD